MLADPVEPVGSEPPHRRAPVSGQRTSTRLGVGAGDASAARNRSWACIDCDGSCGPRVREDHQAQAMAALVEAGTGSSHSSQSGRDTGQV